MAKITKDMSIGEVLQTDNRLGPILMQFGMECIACPAAIGESLEMACAVHGIDVDEMVDKLNEYLNTDESTENK